MESAAGAPIAAATRAVSPAGTRPGARLFARPWTSSATTWPNCTRRRPPSFAKTRGWRATNTPGSCSIAAISASPASSPPTPKASSRKTRSSPCCRCWKCNATPCSCSPAAAGSSMSYRVWKRCKSSCMPAALCSSPNASSPTTMSSRSASSCRLPKVTCPSLAMVPGSSTAS